MNAEAINETTAASVPEGPGARLKSVREAQGLDLSRAASLLHLSEEKLQALEADDYRELPGSVFVQGYLRNYARLLGAPVEPLLSAYRELGGGETQPNLRISQVRHEVGSGHGVVRLITWGIVIGLIALVVIWWRGYLQWPLQQETVTAEAPAETVEGLDAGPESVVLPPLSDTAGDFSGEIDDQGQASLVLPAPEALSSASDPEAAETHITGDGDDGMPPESGAVPAAGATLSAGTGTAPTELGAERAGPVPEAGAEAQIVMEFGGDSWTEIRDSSGTFKIMGSMTAGTRRVLGGTPPYKVVLGNASAVRILVAGENFDVTPFIRGKVARFTLDPDKLTP
jgi:cytoskeleton protein RodZ